MQFPRFSALMSLYKNEKAEYFDACMQSVLRQTALPSEIVIVFDGSIPDALKQVVAKYRRQIPGVIKTVENEVNRGLGAALADGVTACSCELIARVDTDDILREDRFEKQLLEFRKDPALDICGSHILEFEDNIGNIAAKRVVPLRNDQIRAYQKRRDGFNHASVMYKKSSVLQAGNYQPCLLMEDSLLWVHMFLHDARGKNIDDYLVYVRIGTDMYKRRGGLKYFLKYAKGRRKIYETGYIGITDYMVTIVAQLFVALLPNRLRGFVFKKMLHK